ncbi:MAG: hypothetical protein U5R31_15765 [Acidimicrobiia bacterium]|nr:hypothetical protein [Acidimicrobiia bacterium]
MRSTAVSGLGLVLSGLAALFLAVWWIRHFRRGRRDRRLLGPEEVRGSQQRFIDDIERAPDTAGNSHPPAISERDPR